MYFSATPPLRLKSTQDGYKRGDAEERSFAGGGEDPCAFRADLLVNGSVIVELKAKAAIHPIDKSKS
jgi:hypothetical protein